VVSVAQESSKPDVHHVPKGKIGFVVHKLNQFECNAWIRYWDPEEEKRSSWYTEIPFVKDKPLKLAYHIPHGTPVLVLSEAQELSHSISGDPRIFYRILWGEVDCWIRKEYLINPYVNDP
jgi:hypothetical protein